MPLLSSFLFSKFDQPLVNSSKTAEAPKTSSPPVHGISNTKVANVGGAPRAAATATLQTTTSRANFAEAFPSLYAQQEYHMKQLKAGIPVHRSGKLDSVILPAIYLLTGFGYVYTMYLFGQLVKKS